MSRIGLYAAAIAAFMPSVACCVSCSPDFALRSGSCEVLVAPGAPDVTVFAAEELTNFLSQVFSAPVPLVTLPTAGRTAIVVGTNAWSAAAGLDPTKLKRDGFCLKTDAANRRIYVVGCDDPKHDLARMLERAKPDHWSSRAWERGTLNATYDFLERVVGCRFYFPGELGTIVPRKPVIDVSALDLRSEPDWSLRIVFPHSFGVWPAELGAKDRNQQLEQYRLRTQSRNFGGCHGQFWANYAARFAKTHPEYFALRKDGTRYDNPAGNAPQVRGQHLCQSSKVWDEIYKDAKSYFRGEDAAVRGATSGFDANRRVAWGSYGHYGEFFDVMPNDGNPKCFCADCQAAYRNASQPVEGPASELIWGQTAKLANRIKADGLKGMILQAAYSDYRTLPQVDIPDNVICCLCEPGPASTAYPGFARREFDEIDAWSRKMDGRLWLWTYPGKHDCFNLNIADVPCCVPQATVAYLKRVAPKVMGAFPQTACVNFIYCHLDLYLYSRIAWDNACDADAVLDEYYRLMYGKGATAMRKLFEAFEKDWLELVGEPQPTSIGYRYAPPAEYQMMTGRYTPDRIAGYEALVKDALASVPANSLEARRIAFMNDQLLAPLARRARSYPKTIDPREELAWRAAHKGSVSLLKNGDFATLKHLNIDPNGKVGLDREVYFSAPTSLKIVSTNDLPESRGFYCRAGALQGVKLKPSTRYRLSGFRKTKDVVPVSAMGGTDFLVSKPIDRSLPGGRMPNGTMDWHRFAYEFTTPAKVESGLVTHIGPRFVYATGTIWIDDLRLDELPVSASGDDLKTGANGR